MVKVVFKQESDVDNMLEEIIRRSLGYKTWWNKECRMKKRKVAKNPEKVGETDKREV